MKCPLLVLLEWWEAQPQPIRFHLARLSLIFTGNVARVDCVNLEKDETVPAYRDWLSETLLDCAHFGRCLHARSLIEYLLEERGDAFLWESWLAQMEALQTSGEGSAEEQAAAADQIENHALYRDAWMTAAASWRQLCRGALSLDALRAWMDEHKNHAAFIEVIPPR